jgi:hypothetical protein
MPPPEPPIFYENEDIRVTLSTYGTLTIWDKKHNKIFVGKYQWFRLHTEDFIKKEIT